MKDNKKNLVFKVIVIVWLVILTTYAIYDVTTRNRIQQQRPGNMEEMRGKMKKFQMQNNEQQ